MARLQSLALLAGLVTLFAVVGYGLFGSAAALLILGGAALVSVTTLDRARDTVLWLHRARPLRPREAPGLHVDLEHLTGRAGVARPELLVYPSQMPNAFAVSGWRRPGAVAVSTGLLSLLPTREVRAVLAHEVAHLAHRDSALSLTSGVFVQVTTALSQGFAVLVLLAALLGAGLPPLAQMAPALILVWGAPWLALLLQAALQRTREHLADAEAARLTGDPRGLAMALTRLQAYSQLLHGWLRRLRFLYTSESDAGPAWLRSHPPTHERVARLLRQEALAAAAREGAYPRVA